MALATADTGALVGLETYSRYLTVLLSDYLDGTIGTGELPNRKALQRGQELLDRLFVALGDDRGPSWVTSWGIARLSDEDIDASLEIAIKVWQRARAKTDFPAMRKHLQSYHRTLTGLRSGKRTPRQKVTEARDFFREYQHTLETYAGL